MGYGTTESVFQDRVAGLRGRLKDPPRSGVDTAWVLQPENRRYLSGFRAGDGQLTESSGSLLISGGACVLVTDSRTAASILSM